MDLLRRRRAAPRPEPAAAPDAAAVLLASLGAAEFVVPRGFWCYVLWQGGRPGCPGAEAFYAGHSEPDHLARRLGDHIDKWGARLTGVSAVQCDDEHDMLVTELYLIRKLEKLGHPLINNIGTAEYERRRRAVQQMQQSAPYLGRSSVPSSETNPAGGAR